MFMDTIDFKSFFESSPGLYLVLTPDFRIVAASDAYLLATMTTRSEINGRNIFDVFPDNPNDNTADGVSTLRESLMYTLRHKLPHTMAVQKYDIRTPSGEYIEKYWSPLNKPLLNKKHDVVYIIHRVEDVTEYILLKKQQDINDKANEELREQIEIFNRSKEIQDLNRVLEAKVEERTFEILKNESRYRALIENSNDIISLLDKDFNVFYRSPSAVKITGWSNEEMMGVSGIINIHPDDVKHAKNIVRQIFEKPGTPLECRFRNKHKEGHYLWVEGTVTNLLQDEQVNAIVFNFRDVTESVEAQLKVKRANRLYNFISQVNQNVVHAKSEIELFENICKLAIDNGGFKIAWIGEFKEENTIINLISQTGISIEDEKLFINAPCAKEGIQCQVIQTKSYYLSNDLENDLRLSNWKFFREKYAISSCMVLPILKNAIIIGTLNLYSSELNYFDTDEIKLLNEVVADISFAVDIFEKNKQHQITELKIQQNEMRFRSLIERSNDMKCLTSLEGKHLYCSPTITKFLGYSVEEYLQLDGFSLIHPDDRTGLKENIEKILNNPGSSFYRQQRIFHKLGHWVWCEGTITNMLHDSAINALVINFRDISERKELERQREFDNNNLNALINNTKDLMWSLDRDYRLITFNDSYSKMTKILSGKTLSKGQNVLDAGFPEEQVPKFKAYYDRVFSGETFTQIEHLNIPKEFWSEISFYPIKKGEEVIGAACYSHEITDLKLAEQKLIESETFNKTVLNALNSHIAVVSSNGVIIAVNDSWMKFGIENDIDSDEKVVIHSRIGVGSNYFEVCERAYQTGDLSAKEALNGIKNVMDGSIEMFTLEYPCDSKTTQRWFAMRVLKLESIKPMVVVAHLDITERKMSEIERLKITQDLIIKNRDLEQFSYIVSHNLRAPVANIIGLSDVLNSNGLDGLMKMEIMDSLSISINRLDEVINDLNNILKTKSAVHEEKIKVNFSNIANEVYLSLENIIEKDEAKIEWDFSEVNEIVSLKSYIYSIFFNLISNSLKYRQLNLTPMIEIRSLLNENKVELHFSDNGIGIDLQKRSDQVFGLYKRFHVGTIEGKGIGLFMVKTQVESLGGSIRIESSVNVGTKFVITFSL